MAENPFMPWKMRSRRQALDCGKWLNVELHTVELPDGRVIKDWPLVITPDYVNVLAETAEGDFLVFRQVKYALAGTSLAPVGGYIEPGEDPLAAAQRELLEETGHRASDWIKLGTFCVDPNRGIATGHLYLARGAIPAAEPLADDLEEQALLHLDRAALRAALAAGEFKVLAWASVVALAMLHDG